MPRPPSCWVISDGRQGIENQALGLAEALERLSPVKITRKQIAAPGSFTLLGPRLQAALKPKPEHYGLAPPYPDIVIGCGRQAIAPLMVLKRAAGARVLTVYVQDPRISPGHFDLVVAPEHDSLSGPNVLDMIGSPNRITPDRLKREMDRFRRELKRYPAPRTAVLIGGTSKTHRLGRGSHARHLAAAHHVLDAGGCVLVTTSRRTPDWAVDDYKKLSAGHDRIWLFTGGGPNPYFAMLAAADHILVTQDSTNMLTEACTAGKPVYTLPMDGRPGKFQALYDSLAERCHVRPFAGKWDNRSYAPLDETDRIAKDVWKRFESKM